MKIRHALVLLLASAAPIAGAAYGAGGSGSETPSQPGSTIQVAMTLYAGGVTLGHVDLNTTIRGDLYHSVSNLQTGGVVNVVWQSEIQATANGTVGPKNNFHPSLYDSFYTGRSDKKQEVSLTYDNSGPTKLYANPTYPTTGYEVPPDQQKNTFDPLSAITYFVSGVHMANPDNPCDVKLPVFDGRRRYDVGFEKVKDVNVTMDNGLYKGKAVLCQMHYKQISGYKPRVLKDNAKFPIVNAWVVTMPSAVTGRPYVVPLRVWADTEYGVIAGVTNKLVIDGVTPKT